MTARQSRAMAPEKCNVPGGKHEKKGIRVTCVGSVRSRDGGLRQFRLGGIRQSGERGSQARECKERGKGKTVRLVIGSGPMGGALYPIAGGIAAIINEHVEGGNASVQVTAGGIENTRMIGSGEIDLGLSSAQQCYDAVHNSGMYEGENLQLNVLGTLHSTVTQIAVLADSGLKDVEDLKGKK